VREARALPFIGAWAAAPALARTPRKAAAAAAVWPRQPMGPGGPGTGPERTCRLGRSGSSLGLDPVGLVLFVNNFQKLLSRAKKNPEKSR
jgi:hypothetical protein